MKRICATTNLVVVTMLFAGAQSLAGQIAPFDSSSRTVRKTELEFELLSEGGLRPGLHAQKWGRIFQDLRLSLRVRRPILDDKPELKEQHFGTIRRVTAIGRLDEQGRMVFPNHAFTFDEIGRLKEWVEELRTYGAQGSPVGKPAFGLNPDQFHAVITALSTPINSDLRGKTIRQSLELLELPPELPLRLSTEATRHLDSLDSARTFTQSVPGLTTGTGLAALLSEFGLAFRPLRTPSGSIELVAEPLGKCPDPWPVGWALPQNASRLKVAPQFFKLHPMELNDVPLPDVLQSVAVASGMPVLIDKARVEREGIDLQGIRVSFPFRQSSWSLLLRAVTNPHKLTRRLLLDEAGQPFVWITTLHYALKNPAREMPLTSAQH